MKKSARLWILWMRWGKWIAIWKWRWWKSQLPLQQMERQRMSTFVCRKTKIWSMNLWHFGIGRQEKSIIWQMTVSFWQRRWQRRWMYPEEIRSISVWMERKRKSLSQIFARITWSIMFTWLRSSMKSCTEKNQDITVFSLIWRMLRTKRFQMLERHFWNTMV